MENNSIKERIRTILILFMSLSLILLAQFVKVVKNPEKGTPITGQTFLGLLVLGTITVLGIIVQKLLQRQPVKVLKEFPVLGWVSMISLVFCTVFPFAIKAIHAVDFLAITTTILTFAGISIADRLGDLKRVSWKIVIVGMFVFIGTYFGSALVAQIGFIISGR